MAEHQGHGVDDVRNAEDRRADAQHGDADGLSSTEAAERLQRYGPNAIEEERHSILLEVLSHFWGPIPWMIEAALVLTAATGKWLDFVIILALLLLNGGVGFWEEHQAQGAIAALKARLATTAEVRRDGEWRELPAREVVPGDVVRTQRGQVVAADGRLVSGSAEVDESALTGESLPVPKEPGDPVFSGSAVSRGSTAVRVLATGMRTQFGRTAQLAGREAPQSHFQQTILHIGTYLIAVAVALVAVIVAVSLARGTGVSETMEFALVVTIASIPVALPAVLSVTMAVGARYLAHHEAVVSHLPAVEELAGVDVLCADKTGTITQNQLAVADVAIIDDGWSGGTSTATDDGAILLQAALTGEPDSEDPVDTAILAAAGAHALDGWEVLSLEPFDPTRKRAEAQARGPDGLHLHVVKGAVQAVEALTAAAGDVAAEVARATNRFAEKGYRALAVAVENGGSWHITGVLALQDPPREDSGDTLEQAARLGVEVKMITGDRVEIAREIARTVGIGERIVEAAQIQGVTGDDLAARAEAANGFAEVVPEDKYRIVAALQGRDHIVGMTGDGVNDAAALRRADAGIAVSGATDAARAAADIVLLAPGLSTIVEAIYRSREVFQRMKNYAIYRITETIRVVFFVTLTIVAFAFFPVTPIQVVLLAILNDAAILSIAYDRVLPSSRPERWDLTQVMAIAAVLGFVGMLSTFGLAWATHGPLALTDDHVRTLIYLKLSVSGHLTVFLARTQGPFWSHRPAGVLLLAVIGTQAVATVIALTGFLMEPIGWNLVALAWGWAVAEFLLLDPVKLAAYRQLERRGAVAEVTTAEVTG